MVEEVEVLEGEAWEAAYLDEVLFFDRAEDGVEIDDVLAAMICRREEEFEILNQLHSRLIRVALPITDDATTEFHELIFAPTT
jgi:hypothetical protein